MIIGLIVAVVILAFGFVAGSLVKQYFDFPRWPWEKGGTL